MKQASLLLVTIIFLSCNSNSPHTNTMIDSAAKSRDTITYAYVATFSSDLTVPANPSNAQKVLTVWKLYEQKQFDAMRSYYADTVTYDAASGYHYHGPAEGLLAIAKKEMDKLDSLRFDISMWESAHSNDKNEDWVNVWCTERSYPTAGKPDTNLMYEQWKIKDGKVYYFNQYYAKMPRSNN